EWGPAAGATRRNAGAWTEGGGRRSRPPTGRRRGAARFAGGAPSVPTGQGSLGSGRLLVHLDRERGVVAVERRLRDDATPGDADRELSALGDHRQRQPAVALDERFDVARRHVCDLAERIADLVIRGSPPVAVAHRRCTL